MKERLESHYRLYWENAATRADILSHWKDHLDAHPEDTATCVEILLNAELIKTDSHAFLRDTHASLAYKILSFALPKDETYFNQLDDYLSEVAQKAIELGFNEHTTPIALRAISDPKHEDDIDDQQRPKLKEFKEFLETRVHPIGRSKQLSFLLSHFAKIDLTRINWVEKIRYLVDMSYASTSTPHRETVKWVAGALPPYNTKTCSIINAKFEFFQKIKKISEEWNDAPDDEQARIEFTTKFINDNQQDLNNIYQALIIENLWGENSLLNYLFMYELVTLFKNERKKFQAALIQNNPKRKNESQEDYDSAVTAQTHRAFDSAKSLDSPEVRNKFLLIFLWHLKNANVDPQEVHRILTHFLETNKLHTQFTPYEIERFYRKIDPKIHTPELNVATTQGGPRGRHPTHKNEDAYATDALDARTQNFTPKQKEFFLKRVFEKLQKRYGQHKKTGSTALACLAIRGTYSVANVGDSAAFLVIRDKDTKKISTLKQINELHTGENVKEVNRVGDKGEFVDQGRLKIKTEDNNGLAVTRAIGDTHQEQAGLIHEPEIHEEAVRLNENQEAFIIVTSDGFTEPDKYLMRPSKGIIRYLTEKLDEFRGEVEALPKYLVQEAIRDGSTDNVTVTTLRLNPEDEMPRFAAVFDGHGGREVSLALQQNMHDIMQEEIEYELVRQQRLASELERLKKRTEAYRKDLNNEIDEDKATFFSDFYSHRYCLDYNPITQEVIIHNTFIPEAKKSLEPINEKIRLRNETDKLLTCLKAKTTDDDKLETYARMLFEKSRENPHASTLAQKIEATRTGADYLKAAVGIIATVVAGATIIGLIPLIAYRYSTNKWLWQTEGKGITHETEKDLQEFLHLPKTAPAA